MTLRSANFALELKRELINLTLESKSPRVRLSGVDKSLPVLSSIGTWLIVGVSGIRVIVDVAGIDTQPLLALGGISGIAFGIGAQNFIRSLLAGVSLVSCHGTSCAPCQAPFVVDRSHIQLVSVCSACWRALPCWGSSGSKGHHRGASGGE